MCTCHHVQVPILMSHIREQLKRYLQVHPSEHSRLAELQKLLATEGSWTQRSHMAGHVTATAVVTNSMGELLLVHHRLHEVWWPPGGHAEDVDRTLAGAALREAAEETCIDPAVAVLADPVPLDIEVTAAPANPARQEGQHQHFDFRYWYTAPRVALRPQQAEVHGAAWRPIRELDAPGLVAALEARLATASSPA
jgi:ADP-ribose pyrophosphatase YjhB (NUDIX family)